MTDPLVKRLRCHSVVEGREQIVNEDGDPTGRTRVTSLTASFWDVEIPREMHTDRKYCVIVTTMNPDEFDFFQLNGVYIVSVERS